MEHFVKKYYEYHTYQIKDLKVMPNRKINHSKNVAKLVKTLTNSIDVYDAALYHDYLERGGKEKKAKKVLSYYAHKLVLALTKQKFKNTKKISTLDDLKMKFETFSNTFKNDVIYIKLCDRTDNLNKRMKSGKISKKYIKKSIDLIQFLYDNYIGDKDKIKNFILENLPILKNEIIFDGDI